MVPGLLHEEEEEGEEEVEEEEGEGYHIKAARLSPAASRRHARKLFSGWGEKETSVNLSEHVGLRIATTTNTFSQADLVI